MTKDGAKRYNTAMTKKSPTKAELEAMEQELADTLQGIFQKPAKKLKSPDKMPSMKEQRKRWKLIDGKMVEMGSDDDD